MKLTLTARYALTPAEWRAAWKRYRMQCVRSGVSLVWRVELQRRGVPHIHALVWLSVNDSGQYDFKESDTLTRGWLLAINEWQDLASRRHAVKLEPMTRTAWVMYLVAHNSKHKESQLGWVGKQWGIIGRERFVRREAVEFDLTSRERAVLQRMMRGFLKSLGARCRGVPARGRWLRLMDGETAARMVAWTIRERAGDRAERVQPVAAVERQGQRRTSTALGERMARRVDRIRAAHVSLQTPLPSS